MLQTSQIAAVREVAAAAPDSALRKLEAALRVDGGGGRTVLVRDLLEAELAERDTRNGVFLPLLALCATPRHAVGAQLFAARTPARLWAALKIVASEDTQALLAGCAPEAAEPVRNRLCLRAAAGLRGGEEEFLAASETLEPEALKRLALALELAPLARTALEALPVWFARATGAHIAAMRLIYKDAARLGDDAGPMLMEMLLAAVDEPWRILQLVSWVMDRPEERFVAESELAGVALRLIDSLNFAVLAAKGADFARGSEAGLEAAGAVERGFATVAALETAFSLKRGPWAEQVKMQRGALAGAAEARLREAEALVNAVLPAPPLKIAGRTLGGGSRFSAAPEADVLSNGRALLTFLSETHAVAETGGFSVLWARTAKAVDERLAASTDELIAMLHAGTGEARLVRGCLEAAAELTAVMRGPQAGGLVRRRAAAV